MHQSEDEEGDAGSQNYRTSVVESLHGRHKALSIITISNSEIGWNVVDSEAQEQCQKGN